MRIIYLCQYFNRPDQSGSSRAFEMSRRWAEAGHDVQVVTSEKREHFSGWRTEVVNGVTIHRTSVPYDNKLSPIRRVGAFGRYALRAALKARSLKGDVVFATSTPLTIVFPAWVATVGTKVKYVFEVRDLWPTVPIALGYLPGKFTQFTARAVERAAYRFAHHVIALSPDMAKEIVLSGVSRDKVSVVSNSSDIALFQSDTLKKESLDEILPPEVLASRKPLILYSGTFGVVNNVEYLVELMASLDRPESINLVLVGDGARRQAIVDLAARSGLLNRSIFVLSPLPKKLMPALFSRAVLTASTVAQVPELAANSANKVFDSFAAGKPVMINHEGWQADLLRTSGAGIVVPASDPRKGAQIVQNFVGNNSLVEFAGETALGLAKSQFSRDEAAKAVLLVLEQAGVSPHAESNSVSEVETGHGQSENAKTA